MTPRLGIAFIVEPPVYQVMACYLAASLREQFGETVALYGYCPEHRWRDLDPDVRTLLARMRCDLRPFHAEGRFAPAYPHGNKILALLEPRETEFSAFMDSDILCLRPNRVESLIHPGHVALTPAASMIWADQSVWTAIYGAVGLAVPEERFRLMRQKRGQPRIPYFSSGLLAFPEAHRTPEGLSFPQVWMEVAQTLDAAPEIPRKRPYLDQMSLPLAIAKAGLSWHLLPEEQHYILGGRMRGQPLPEGREIFTVHYRTWDILRELGLSRQGKDMLERQTGVRRVAQAGKATASQGGRT